MTFAAIRQTAKTSPADAIALILTLKGYTDYHFGSISHVIETEHGYVSIGSSDEGNAIIFLSEDHPADTDDEVQGMARAKGTRGVQEFVDLSQNPKLVTLPRGSNFTFLPERFERLNKAGYTFSSDGVRAPGDDAVITSIYDLDDLSDKLRDSEPVRKAA